ncbi:transposase [Serratia ureilytica]|nr:transposase [Serratia ureilytica]
MYNYRSYRDDRAQPQRIREIAAARVHYGCHAFIFLRREGGLVNHKKTHRIYCLEGLNLRTNRYHRYVTARHRRVPLRFQVDNGSKSISKSLDRWAYENKVMMVLSLPGKTTDNALLESFYDGLRDKCLNVCWFLSLEDAQEKIDCRRQDVTSKDLINH